jgi:TonB family protein
LKWRDRARARALLAAALLALVAACRTTAHDEARAVDLRAADPDYFRLVEQRINRNWGPGRAGAPEDLAAAYDRTGGGIVVVSFSIGKRGEIVGKPAVEESSGSEFLDQEALRAVTSAAPFPPLPSSIGTDRVDLLWRFEHLPSRRPSE